MSLVVEEVPLRSLVVGEGAGPVVSVGKGLGSSANEGMFFDKLQSAGPDNATDVTTLGPPVFELGASGESRGLGGDVGTEEIGELGSKRGACEEGEKQEDKRGLCKLPFDFGEGELAGEQEVVERVAKRESEEAGAGLGKEES